MPFETVLKGGESSFLPRFATLHVPGQLPALIQCNRSFRSEQGHLPFMTDAHEKEMLPLGGEYRSASTAVKQPSK